MDKILVDTNVFIEIFKGKKELLDYISSYDVFVNPIIMMELYIGAFNKNEIKKFEDFFKSFNVVMLNEKVSRLAIELVKTYSKSSGLLLPDAFIAATCLDFSLELFTFNVRDFKFIDKLKLHRYKN